MTRTAWVNLLVGLAVGAALGLIYAWVINPVQVVDAAPNSLRADYKADYVAMIAQAYALDRDLTLARARLATLNAADPARAVSAAAAQQAAAGAPAADLNALAALAAALQAAP